jgi:hypothetical protein
VVGEYGNNGAVLEATGDGFVGLFMSDLRGDQPFSVLMTPSGKPTIVFGRKTARLELGVVDDDPAGEEFSMRLLNTKHSVVWQPPVRSGTTLAEPVLQQSGQARQNHPYQVSLAMRTGLRQHLLEAEPGRLLGDTRFGSILAYC